MAKDERRKWSEKSSSDQLLGRTAIRKTTYLSPKVPRMEEEVSLSLDYEISQKTDLD